MLPGEYMTGGLKKEQRSREVKLHAGAFDHLTLDVKTCYRHQITSVMGKGGNRSCQTNSSSGIGPNRNATKLLIQKELLTG